MEDLEPPAQPTAFVATEYAEQDKLSRLGCRTWVVLLSRLGSSSYALWLSFFRAWVVEVMDRRR